MSPFEAIHSNISGKKRYEKFVAHVYLEASTAALIRSHVVERFLNGVYQPTEVMFMLREKGMVPMEQKNAAHPLQPTTGRHLHQEREQIPRDLLTYSDGICRTTIRNLVLENMI